MSSNTPDNAGRRGDAFFDRWLVKVAIPLAAIAIPVIYLALNKPSLSANILSVDYELSPQWEGSQVRVRDAAMSEINKLVSDSGVTKPDQWTIREAADAVASAALLDPLASLLSEPKSFFVIDLTNPGGEVATNVIIDCSQYASGFASIRRTGGQIENKAWEESFLVGDVAPKEHVSIRMWSSLSPITRFVEDEFVVRYDRGEADLAVRIPVDGYKAMLQRHGWIEALLLSLAITFVLSRSKPPLAWINPLYWILYLRSKLGA